MLWFSGSIRNAVDKVKSTGALLLVFVQGEDSLSEKYEACLNDKTELDDYVAIKIPHGSTALEQFRQIYVSVPVPSVFLIQNNGIPLKVVSSFDTSELKSAINDVIKNQKLKQEKKQKMNSNNGLIPSDNNKKEEISPELSHVKNIGRKVFDISEDELKTRLEKIQAFPKFLLIDSVTTCDPSSSSEKRSKSHSARIQFRLPNNSMPSWEFPDLSTLGDVKAYLAEKMKLTHNFKLFRTYPRYAFTPEDEKKTLSALSLTPNAILIVVPCEDKTVQAKVTGFLSHPTFLNTIMNVMLKLLFGLLGFFKKYFIKNEPADKAPERLARIKSFERTIKKKTHTPQPRSNIHGFKFEEDTDTDTEHPDNGNSTQQRFQ